MVELKAYDVAQEMDLNLLAAEFEIKKKFTWEEPLFIQGKRLTDMLGAPDGESARAALLFSFGSLVLMNMTRDEGQRFVTAMRSYGEAQEWKFPSPHYEKFRVALGGEGETIEFTDQMVSVPEIAVYVPELVATVLAKSVALEREEKRMERILDRVGPIVERFEKGKLSISNRQRATIVAEIARFQYASLSYIMILDKPDITWMRSDAEDLYRQMSEFFELSDRYEVLRAKSESVEKITGAISSMNDHSRSMLIEWVILILILAEVVLMVLDLLK